MVWAVSDERPMKAAVAMNRADLDRCMMIFSVIFGILGSFESRGLVTWGEKAPRRVIPPIGQPVKVFHWQDRRGLGWILVRLGRHTLS
jgi:hypothetical protein